MKILLPTLLALALSPPLAAQCDWAGDATVVPVYESGGLPRYFGRALSVDGDWMLVGAPGLDGNHGEAHFFLRSGGLWTPREVFAGDLAPLEDGFGRAVCLLGDLAVVGAPDEDAGLGAVYVLRRTDGQWVLEDVLRPTAIDLDWGDDWDWDWDEEDGDDDEDELDDDHEGDHTWPQRFGSALALSPGRIAVGAPGVGEVHLFQQGPEGWQAESVLEPDGIAFGFGKALSLDGDSIAVGAPGSGAAFVFARSDAGWQQTTALNAGGAPWDFENDFGASVSLEGGRLVVGAPGTDEERGAAHVFGLYATDWAESALLSLDGAKSGTNYGSAVAQLEGAVLVSAPADKNGGQGVFLYEPQGPTWSLEQEFRPDPDVKVANYGNAIELSNGAVMMNVGIDEHPVFKYAGQVETWSSADSGDCTRLTAFPGWLSVADGGQQSLVLSAGAERAFDPYFLLGSTSGTTPGIALGALTLPLVSDAYFWMTASEPGETPLGASFGLFDSKGRAHAAFDLGSGIAAGAAGLVVHHAFVVLDPFQPVAVSNAVSIELRP